MFDFYCCFRYFGIPVSRYYGISGLVLRRVVHLVGDVGAFDFLNDAESKVCCESGTFRRDNILRLYYQAAYITLTQETLEAGIACSLFALEYAELAEHRRSCAYSGNEFIGLVMLIQQFA